MEEKKVKPIAEMNKEEAIIDIYNSIIAYAQNLQNLGRADHAAFYYQGKEDACRDILSMIEMYF